MISILILSSIIIMITLFFSLRGSKNMIDEQQIEAKLSEQLAGFKLQNKDSKKLLTDFRLLLSNQSEQTKIPLQIVPGPPIGSLKFEQLRVCKSCRSISVRSHRQCISCKRNASIPITNYANRKNSFRTITHALIVFAFGAFGLTMVYEFLSLAILVTTTILAISTLIISAIFFQSKRNNQLMLQMVSDNREKLTSGMHRDMEYAVALVQQHLRNNTLNATYLHESYETLRELSQFEGSDIVKKLRLDLLSLCYIHIDSELEYGQQIIPGTVDTSYVDYLLYIVRNKRDRITLEMSHHYMQKIDQFNQSITNQEESFELFFAMLRNKFFIYRKPMSDHLLINGYLDKYRNQFGQKNNHELLQIILDAIRLEKFKRGHWGQNSPPLIHTLYKRYQSLGTAYQTQIDAIQEIIYDIADNPHCLPKDDFQPYYFDFIAKANVERPGLIKGWHLEHFITHYEQVVKHLGGLYHTSMEFILSLSEKALDAFVLYGSKKSPALLFFSQHLNEAKYFEIFTKSPSGQATVKTLLTLSLESQSKPDKNRLLLSCATLMMKNKQIDDALMLAPQIFDFAHYFVNLDTKQLFQFVKLYMSRKSSHLNIDVLEFILCKFDIQDQSQPELAITLEDVVDLTELVLGSNGNELKNPSVFNDFLQLAPTTIYIKSAIDIERTVGWIHRIIKSAMKKLQTFLEQKEPNFVLLLETCIRYIVRLKSDVSMPQLIAEELILAGPHHFKYTRRFFIQFSERKFLKLMNEITLKAQRKFLGYLGCKEPLEAFQKLQESKAKIINEYYK